MMMASDDAARIIEALDDEYLESISVSYWSFMDYYRESKWDIEAWR